jgi:hypothetical protein
VSDMERLVCTIDLSRSVWLSMLDGETDISRKQLDCYRCAKH